MDGNMRYEKAVEVLGKKSIDFNDLAVLQGLYAADAVVTNNNMDPDSMAGFLGWCINLRDEKVGNKNN